VFGVLVEPDIAMFALACIDKECVLLLRESRALQKYIFVSSVVCVKTTPYRLYGRE